MYIPRETLVFSQYSQEMAGSVYAPHTVEELLIDGTLPEPKNPGKGGKTENKDQVFNSTTTKTPTP